MKNYELKKRAIYLSMLSIIVLLSTLFLPIANSNVKDLKQNSLLTSGNIENEKELDESVERLIERVKNSSKDCWKRPGRIRKLAMRYKLMKLKFLIHKSKFETAYRKLLYDIKPKLTGLKTDENEQAWAKYNFKCPDFGRSAWIVCKDLRELFRIDCNSLLVLINQSGIPDDDTSPPIISIEYLGDKNINNPGVWQVEVGDPESGLDEVKIEINGILEVHETNLGGKTSILYQNLPSHAILSNNTIIVTATNNDKDFAGDQETAMASDWVILKEPSPPLISIEYLGENLDSSPGVWNAFVEDLEEGLEEVVISLDGNVQIQELLDGSINGSYMNISVPSSKGEHIINVSAKNTEGYIADQQLIAYINDDDTTGPIIQVEYIGSGTDYDPGIWNVNIEDLESGLERIIITVNGFLYLEDNELGGQIGKEYTGNPYEPGGEGIPCPRSIMTHRLEIWTWNNDKDCEGDQESSYLLVTQEIVPDPIFT
jgi:hypothetical protein